MSKKKYINPELSGGFRDYLPSEMIIRQKMLDTIRFVFETFGFLPLDTPGIEKEEVLTGGDPNFKMQLFRVGLKKGNEDLALRFDLTVPLARVMSLYSEQIEKPFKRYQIGKVWRGEKPQAGRYREFIQFDADIVGSSRISADAEIVALMYKTMKSLGFERFVIKINNRKILNGLSEFIGYKEIDNIEALRTIDKMDKIGLDGVLKELSEKLNLDKSKLEKFKKFLALQSVSSAEVISKVSMLMAESKSAMEGVNELTEIAKNLDALGVPEKFWRFDLSVARGLGYYTGPVFETILLDLPNIGSVFSGGRYDDLVSRFSQQNLPATGASVGVDRLFAAMESLGLVKSEKTLVKALVLNFDKEAEDYCQKIVTALREINIPSEIYLGKEINLKGQLAYAVKQEIPFVIIAGAREKEEQVVQIKDMNRRDQKTVSFKDLQSEMKKNI